MVLSGVIAFLALAGQQYEELTKKVVPSYEVEMADVRPALTKLFEDMGYDVLLPADVDGKVTLSLRNVTFEIVLQNMLRQVNGTYRIEKGRFEIVLKEVIGDAGPDPYVDPGPQAHQATAQDGDSVYVFEDMSLSRFRKSDMKLVKKVRVERRFHKTTADLADPKGREALQKAFREADVYLTIAPEAKGKVTIPEGPATQMDGILALAKSLGTSYYIVAGEYKFVQPISKHVSTSMFNFSPIEDKVVNITPLLLDKNFLYLVDGRWSYKIRKSDLATVSYFEVPMGTR